MARTPSRVALLDLSTLQLTYSQSGDHALLYTACGDLLSAVPVSEDWPESVVFFEACDEALRSGRLRRGDAVTGIGLLNPFTGRVAVGTMEVDAGPLLVEEDGTVGSVVSEGVRLDDGTVLSKVPPPTADDLFALFGRRLAVA